MIERCVSKQMAIITIALCYGGIAIFVIGVILTMYLEPMTTGLRLIMLVPGLAIFSCGSYIMSKKCRCPCADEADRRKVYPTMQRGLITIRNLRKGYFTCPICDKTVEFK
jgi:hypothetical protein